MFDPIVASPATGSKIEGVMNGRMEWVFVDPTDTGAVQVGDLVSAAAGGMPTYRVVELNEDGLACLRDEREAEQVMPIDRFFWKACE